MKAQERGEVLVILGFAAACVAAFASPAIIRPISFGYFGVLTSLVALIVATHWMPKRAAQVIGGLAVATGSILPIFANRIFGEAAGFSPAALMYVGLWLFVKQCRKPTPPPADPTADTQPPT